MSVEPISSVCVSNVTNLIKSINGRTLLYKKVKYRNLITKKKSTENQLIKLKKIQRSTVSLTLSLTIKAPPFKLKLKPFLLCKDNALYG